MKKTIFLLIGIATISVTHAQQKCTWLGSGKKVNPYLYNQVKSASFKHAAASSAHPLASLVGAQIMQHGGNAFDAAIAMQWTLAVVYPGAGNIGGGGFLVSRKSDGKLFGLDYREMAPLAATKDMYINAKGEADTKLSQNGHLAAGVPGTVAGLFATLPHAKLSMHDLIQPAIDLAEYGFVLTQREASSLNSNKAGFEKYNTSLPVFVKATLWKAGDTLIQKDLAATLKRIQADGAKGFYEGKTAELIVAEMEKGKGIITTADLETYTAKQRELLSFNYKNYEITGFPPPSSGGILLLQMMKMVANYPLAKMGFQTSATVQLMVEAERRAYADRAEHMGDPDFWKVPVKTLTSDTYIANRMKDFVAGKATESVALKGGVVKESEETTHLSVYDALGNMVSVTTTLNGGYGSRTVVAGAGFLLNNEMDDFSIQPGVANMYGALGGEANAIVPSKRMLSSMCPVVVTKDGKPFLVVGTPGGTTIPTSVYQTLLNMIEFNMNVSDAVNKPKFHHQHLPDEVYVEKTFPKDVRGQLENMGYKIVERSAIGRTEAIHVKGKNSIDVAADKRGDDSVAGY